MRVIAERKVYGNLDGEELFAIHKTIPYAGALEVVLTIPQPNQSLTFNCKDDMEMFLNELEAAWDRGC